MKKLNLLSLLFITLLFTAWTNPWSGQRIQDASDIDKSSRQDNYVLSWDDATGTYDHAENTGSGSSEWTEAGGILSNNTGSDDVSISNTVYVDAGNGRVGIGTTSPVAKLDINGDVTVSSDVTVDGRLYLYGGLSGNSITSNTLTASTELFVGNNEVIDSTGIDGEFIKDNTIDEDSIDFGSGTDQIDINDIPNALLADSQETITQSWIFDDDVTISGYLHAGVRTLSVTGNTTLIPADAKNVTVYVGANTVTLPAIADGMNVSFKVIKAVTAIIDSNASDSIWLDGTKLDDGDSIDSAGAAGDVAVCEYYSADGWWCTTNSWTDGGAS